MTADGLHAEACFPAEASSTGSAEAAVSAGDVLRAEASWAESAAAAR
jgi:hypothetical protein